jgi:hypothetical protein
MRTLVAIALVSSGCSKLLGISDPVAASGDGGVADVSAGDGEIVDGSLPGGSVDGASIDGMAIDGVVVDGMVIDGGVPPCIAPPSFAGPDTYSLGGAPGLMGIGRFDNDGNRDVAIALTTKVLILHGNGLGGFGSRQEIDTAADGLLVEDFETDVHDDLVLWTVGGSRVVARHQDPDHPGMFLLEQPLDGPFQGVRRVVQGLLDGGFRPDVITQDDVERQVYTSSQLNPGTFLKGDKIGKAGDQVVQVANLIGADSEDIVLLTAAGDVQIASQISGRFLTPPVEVATGVTGTAAQFGQFDGDSERDLIVATASGGVLYRRGGSDTSPTFTRVPGEIAGVTGPTLQIVDVDGNGLDDIVVADGIVQQCTPGVFSPLVRVATSASTVFFDLDGNHKPEMLRTVGQTLEVYRQ